MDTTLAQFATADFIGLSAVIGASLEAGKQCVAYAAPSVVGGTAYKTLLAVIPLVAGVTAGLFIFDESAGVHPAIMGGLAGSFSSTVYSAMAPTIKRLFGGGE